MISIIVPIYNSEKFLKRCLDSIIQQTYQGIEVILIDDGSVDASPAICDEYAAQDSRIRVVHKKNEGVSVARNTGIDLAQGEWVAFVDSDDWIEPDYVSTLLCHAKDVDIIICNCSHSKAYYGDEIADFVETDVKTFSGTSSCFKLISKTLIYDNSIRFFANFNYGEDTIFSLELLRYCQGIRLLEYNGYHVNHSELLVTEKYNQSLEDIDRKISALQTVHKLLGERFNRKFDISSDICKTIMMFPLNQILNGADKVYEQLWMRYFPDSSVEELYNDRNCSPLIRSITLLKYLAKQKQYRRTYQIIRGCYSLWGDTYSRIKYPYASHGLIGRMIGRSSLFQAFIITTVYSKITSIIARR